MRPLALWALLAAVVLAGSADAASREPRIVVFTTAQTEIAFAYVPDLGDPYWRPTADEVNLVRRGLGPYLRRQADPRAKEIADNLGDYGLQLAGVAGPDGPPLMVINGFCDVARRPDWRTNWVGVDDGGRCYFQAYWERPTRRFRGFLINGDG